MEAGVSAEAIIEKLGLQPHPEGGWYRETWKGPEVGGRASGTAILFLLQEGERSHWHRVDADEIWLWHAGAPLVLAMGETAATEVRLGPDVLGGEVVQAVVPSGWWQAARPLGEWTLVSCTVSPGFRFEGFELAPPGWELPLEG
jgi:predicted cupin superfamily sugar epimerase